MCSYVPSLRGRSLTAIIIFSLSVGLIGCGGSYSSTDADSVSGSATDGVSGSAVGSTSGSAISGSSVEATDETKGDLDREIDEYVSKALTPEILSQLEFLSENQELWCDEISTKDEYVNTYAITDMDHDGQLEIAQNVDLQYVYYTEVTGSDGEYGLEQVKKYSVQDYALGIHVWGDQSEGYVTDESPTESLKKKFRPRTEAKWVLPYITEDIIPTDLPEDEHLIFETSFDMFFMNHLILRIHDRIDSDKLYEALLASLKAFYTDDAISYTVRNELILLSDGYVNFSDNAANMPDFIDFISFAVTDLDGDMHPEILFCKSGHTYGTSEARGVLTDADGIVAYGLTESESAGAGHELTPIDLDLSEYTHADDGTLSPLDTIWVGLPSDDITDIESSIGYAFMKYAAWKACVGTEPISADAYPACLFSHYEIGNPMVLNHYFYFMVD